MRLKLCLLFAFFLLQNQAQAQTTVTDCKVEDLKVLQAIVALQDTDSEYYKYKWEIDLENRTFKGPSYQVQWNETSPKQVTLLNLSSDRLSGVLNVSDLSQLQSLDCERNGLTNLDVSGLSQLETLDCGNNDLTSLDVSASSQLRSLYCESNDLTSLDVSASSQLLALTCHSNDLTSLEIEGLSELSGLYCYNNQLGYEHFFSPPYSNIINKRFFPQFNFQLLDKNSWELGELLDLSSYQTLEGSESTFKWFDREENEVLVDKEGAFNMKAAVRKHSPGIFSFKRKGEFTCRVFNSAFGDRSDSYLESEAYSFDGEISVHMGDLVILDQIYRSNVKVSSSLGWIIDLKNGTFSESGATVFWDDSTPKRLVGLELSDEGLVGELNLNGLSELQYVKIDENNLKGLKIDELVKLGVLDCSSNALDIQGLFTPSYSLLEEGTFLPQRNVAISEKKDWGKEEVIDLTKQAQIYGTDSRIEWYDKQTNNKLGEDTPESPNEEAWVRRVSKGKYFFKKGGQYTCRIYNEKLSAQEGEYLSSKPIGVISQVNAHPDDLAVLKAILENQKLNSSKELPWKVSLEEGVFETTDRTETTEWSNSEPNRLIALNIPDQGLSGRLNLNLATQLQRLDVSENRSLIVLKVNKLIGLGTLEAQSCKIKNLDVRDLSNLETLDVSYNGIRKIVLPTSSVLKKLIAQYNNLKSLTIKNHGLLEELDLNYCQLNTLKLENLPRLKKLDCKGNMLRELDLATLVSLEGLNVYENAFDLVGLHELTQTTSLDFTAGQEGIRYQKLSVERNENGLVDLSDHLFLQGIQSEFRFIWKISREEAIVDTPDKPNSEATIREVRPGEYLLLKGGSLVCEVNNSFFGEHDYAPLLKIEISNQPDELIRCHPVDLFALQNLLDQYDNKEILPWTVDMTDGTFTPFGQDYYNLVEWNDDVPKRLVKLSLSGDYDIKGVLDLTGVTEIEELSCNRTNLTEIMVDDCHQLKELRLSSNFKVEELDLKNLNKLEEVELFNGVLKKLQLSSDNILKDVSVAGNHLDFNSLKEIERIWGDSRTSSKNRALSLFWQRNVDLLKTSQLESNEVLDLSHMFQEDYFPYEWLLNNNKVLVDRPGKLNDKAVVTEVETGKFLFKRAGEFKIRRYYPEYKDRSHWGINLIVSQPLYVKSTINAHPDDLAVLKKIQEQQGIEGEQLPWEVDLQTNTFSSGDGNATTVWNEEVPSRLMELKISDRDISGDLDLRKAIELKTVYCSRNQLSSLQVANLKNLVNLSIYSNNLTNIDLQSQKELRSISLENNHLSFSHFVSPSNDILSRYGSYFLPQREVQVLDKNTWSTGEVLDFSSQKEFYGYSSIFQWFDAEGNPVQMDTVEEPNLEAEVRQTENGKFSFKIAGSYFCRISNSYFDGDPDKYYLETVSYTVTSKVSANLSFGALTSVNYGDPSFTLSATHDSDGTLSFTIVGYAKGSSIEGTTLQIGNAGTITVRASVSETENYASAYVDRALVIGKKDLTITPNEGQRKRVGEQDSEFGYTVVGLVGDDPVTGALSRESGEEVGQYRILIGSLNAGNNYSMQLEEVYFQLFDLETPSLTFTLNSPSIYGDDPIVLSANSNTDGTLSFSIVGNAKGSSIEGTTLQIGNAGTITVRASVSETENYASAYVDQTMTISKKTVVVIPDADQSKTIGENDPVFAYTVEGLVDEDLLTGQLDRVAGETVGEYRMLVGTLSGGANYTLELAEVNFEIVAYYNLQASFSLGGTVSPVSINLPGNSTQEFTISPESGMSIVEATYNGLDIMDDLVQRGAIWMFTTPEVKKDGIVAIRFAQVLGTDDESAIRVVPNPVHDFLYVSKLQVGARLELLNMNGEIVWKQIAKQNELKINCSSLPSGVYVLRVEGGLVEKIVVKH